MRDTPTKIKKKNKIKYILSKKKEKSVVYIQ
jgi:hypothetical protein